MGPLTGRVLPIVAAIGLLVTSWQQFYFHSLFNLDRFLPVAYLKSDSGDASNTSILGSTAISRRVIAIADLHGDLEHAHNVLRMAGLIDNHYVPNWIGGHDVLVSTGDIVDRGDDTIELYKMFQRLRKQASEAGGGVHNCVSGCCRGARTESSSNPSLSHPDRLAIMR
jgi:hypothetical protein